MNKEEMKEKYGLTQLGVSYHFSNGETGYHKVNESRDFQFTDDLWCVINDDGTFAGRPCLTEDEARELSYQREGRQIYKMILVKKVD